MWQQYTYSDHNGERSYFVYTPESYRVGTAVPLIVMLHGCTQTSAEFADGTAMNQLAEQHNFVVVYPQQTSKHNQARCWNWYSPVNQYRGGKEPASIVGIVRAVQQNRARWTIDPARIYVTGASAGAAMSVILGVTYPDLFAAIGVHSGIPYQAALGMRGALKAMRGSGPDPAQTGSAAYTVMSTFARVVPVIVFHGTSDGIVAPRNGDQVIQQWIQTNRLASHETFNVDFHQPGGVKSGKMPKGHSFIIATWNAPDGEVVLEYWKVAGMGHAWSGGTQGASYTDPRGPNASQAMYNFFAAHPLPTAKTAEASRKTTADNDHVEEVVIGDEASSRPQSALRRVLSNIFAPRKGK